MAKQCKIFKFIKGFITGGILYKLNFKKKTANDIIFFVA